MKKLWLFVLLYPYFSYASVTSSAEQLQQYIADQKRSDSHILVLIKRPVSPDERIGIFTFTRILNNQHIRVEPVFIAIDKLPMIQSLLAKPKVAVSLDFSVQTKYQVLTRVYERMRQESINLDESCSVKRSELDNLKQQYDVLVSRYGFLQESHRILTERNERSKEQLEVTKYNLELMRNSLASHEQKLYAKQFQIAARNGELDSLQQRLHEREVKLDFLQERLQDQQDDLEVQIEENHLFAECIGDKNKQLNLQQDCFAIETEEQDARALIKEQLLDCWFLLKHEEAKDYRKIKS